MSAVHPAPDAAPAVQADRLKLTEIFLSLQGEARDGLAVLWLAHEPAVAGCAPGKPFAAGERSRSGPSTHDASSPA